MEVKVIRMKILLITLFFSLITIQAATAQYDFKIWAEGPKLFTIGKQEMVNVYILNNGTSSDSYTVSFTKQALYQSQDVKHLVNVYMPSNKIINLEPDRSGTTFATVTLMGPINTGSITFKAISDSDGTVERTADTINIITGTSVNLPEFGLMGLILLMLISSLIVSYSFHFS